MEKGKDYYSTKNKHAAITDLVFAFWKVVLIN